MANIWFFFWVLVMLGLVGALAVAAMREKSARKKALANMQPQPLGADLDPGADPMAGADDGFGAEPTDLDENAFQ